MEHREDSVSPRRRRQTDMAKALPTLRVTRREPFAAQVARSLMDFMFSGNIAPGERLPSERQLADSLGVGRTSVREALRSLELLDLIDVRHGGGTFLRGPDTQLFPRIIEWSLLLEERSNEDLLETRLILEGETSQLAAVRRDDADLDHMRDLVSAMATATTPEEFVTLDVAFHEAVANASKNAVLANVHHTISSLLHVWLANGGERGELTAVTRDRGAAVFAAFQQDDEHLPVLRAIEKQDGAEARRAMTLHMVAANARLSEVLARHRS